MEDAFIIAVKSDDKAAHNLKSILLELLDVAHQVAVAILAFAAFGEAAFVGGFDTDENLRKACLHHHFDQFVVICQVDAGFCDEQTAFFSFAPFNQRRQKVFLQGTFVADKIIINHKHVAPPAAIVQGVQLIDELF